MTLDIVMPHYKEPWSVVKPFFDMLSCQKGIDFSELRVRIVHDGVSPFPKSYFADKPYEVVQNSIRHSGVSAARNYGMDRADAKWITFCDCDDTFSNIYSLKFIFDVLGTDDYDLLWNPFYVENNINGQMHLHSNDKFNLIWTHNKYYRLDFLRRIGLRFNETLHMSEDSAFNNVMNLTLDMKRVGTIKSPMPLYVWCWRHDSVTCDRKNLLWNIEGHFDRNVYVTEEFYRHGHPDSDLMVGRTLTDAYVQMTRTDLPEGTGPFMERLRKYYVQHKAVVQSLPEEGFSRVLAASEKEARDAQFLNPARPTVRKWLESLEKCG